MAIRWVISPVIEQATLVGQPIRNIFTGKVKLDEETGQPVLAVKNYRERVPAVFRHLRAAKDANPLIEKCRCQSFAIGRGEVSHVATWCLCRIDCSDMVAIDTDPEVEALFEEDETKWDAIERDTPRSRGWNMVKLDRIRNRITLQGVSLSTFGTDTLLREVIDQIKRKVENLP